MPNKLDFPLLLAFGTAKFDTFVKEVDGSEHKWVMIQSEVNEPLLMVDADGFVRSTTEENEVTDPYSVCHRLIVITDPICTLGEAMQKLKSVHVSEPMSDAVLHNDVIVVLTDLPYRVITGADILGRLLKGIGQEQY
jgi:hypothetical protein